eukprot:EG_transcript_23599
MGCGGTKATKVIEPKGQRPISRGSLSHPFANDTTQAQNADLPSIQLLLSILLETHHDSTITGLPALVATVQPAAAQNPTLMITQPSRSTMASLSLLHELAQENSTRKWEGITLLHELQAIRAQA